VSPADELAAAVAKLRPSSPAVAAHTVAVRITPAAAEALAEWLEHEAQAAQDAHLWTEREPCAWCGEPAGSHPLTLARAINGTEEA
jgi:hypothetical protein